MRSGLAIAGMALALAAFSPAPASAAGWWLIAGGGGGAGCSQATTFLARTSGLSGGQTTAYTNLICSMVTDGTWALMDGLWVFATNTTTTANLNLVSTSFGLTVHGSETFVANNGYTGDGSTGYFDTGLSPSAGGVNYVQNSATIGACDLTNRTTNANTATIGNQGTPSTYSYLVPRNANTFQYDLNGATFLNFANSTAQGAIFLSRTGATQVVAYLNGSSVSTQTDNSLALSSRTMFIGAYNNDGAPADFSADQIAYAFVAGGMTSGQASNFYTDMHTFLVAVGAGSGC